MKRDGEVEGITWRNRETKEPAPPYEPAGRQHRRLVNPPLGSDSAFPPWAAEDYDMSGAKCHPS